MRFSRFERKIFVAITAVALVPLVGALLLGQRALREAYEVGVNPRVRRELERGLDLYRDQFAVLRRAADQIADSVAADHALISAVGRSDAVAARGRLDELLARYGNLARASVDDQREEVIATADRPERLGDSPRLLELARPLLGAEGMRVRLTVAAPNEPFVAYQRAGELVEVFSRLQSSGELVSTFYLVVYMGFLLSTIATALAVGVALSRRVTRRVALLAEATTRVGAGDLSVRVPSDADDEIGDLTKAFNTMVQDLGDSRGRIDYLQRIGAWQDFARRLAHEIKNPLTPIQLAMQEVHRSYRGDDRAYRLRLDDARSIVEEEVATLRRLVGEFSAFARLPEVTLEPADLGEFLHDLSRSLVALAREQTGASEVEVEVECGVADGPLPVDIDAMMLKRAVDNLVRNAVQAIASNRRQRHGRVRISVHREDDSALLEVADDGPGIAPEDSHRVFDPYYTTKNEGTGLGLAIVKKVVLEHGGTIECGPSELGGAAFWIRLPARGGRISRI
jgi:two-component system, NtrC family, nitrogen regulation sensor histidine kinase NtrY